MAGDLVPFKGKEVGAVTLGFFHFPFHDESISAEGKATHVGHYTLTGNFMVNLLAGTAAGVFTLTAANGDMLFLNMQGHLANPADLTQTISIYVVTGGTGRFEGASGNITSDNQLAFAVNLGISPNPYVAKLEGTISTPGANKK
jgi:hypothetical protein